MILKHSVCLVWMWSGGLALLPAFGLQSGTKQYSILASAAEPMLSQHLARAGSNAVPSLRQHGMHGEGCRASNSQQMGLPSLYVGLSAAQTLRYPHFRPRLCSRADSPQRQQC